MHSRQSNSSITIHSIVMLTWPRTRRDRSAYVFQSCLIFGGLDRSMRLSRKQDSNLQGLNPIPSAAAFSAKDSPIFKALTRKGFFQRRSLSSNVWHRQDSNLHAPLYESGVLPIDTHGARLEPGATIPPTRSIMKQPLKGQIVVNIFPTCHIYIIFLRRNLGLGLCGLGRLVLPV